MLVPSLPKNEKERLAALKQLNLLDSLPDEAFDDFTFLASNICGTPISIITLLDETRQWFKSKVGIDASETPREVSFCGHAILSDDVFEVTDALSDERFMGNPLVIGEPRIRFYAGIPIKNKEGLNLGTLCVIDRIPKKLTDTQRNALKSLARQVMAQIELRLTANKNQELNQTLSETVRFNKNIIDNIPATIGYWDKNLICKYANKTYVDKYLKQGIRIIGMSIWDAVSDELALQIKPYIDGVLNGVKQTFEAHVNGKNQQTLQTQVNYIPDFDDAGNVKGFYIFALDITALRQAEEENKLAEKALQSAHEAILITDDQHQLIFVNEGFTQITGYSKNEAIGKNTSFFRSYQHDAKFLARINKHIKEHGFWQGEITNQHKNGNLITALTTIDSILDDDGRVSNFVASFIDITENNKTKTELASTVSMLERTGKIANIGGWEYDFNKNIARWSDQIYAIRELDTKEQPTHEFALSFFPEEARAVLSNAFQRCIEDSTPFDLELPLVTAKGNHIWIRTMGEMTFEKGRKSKIVGIFQDISSRKKQEQIAINKEIELRKAIVREVHHHIKNNIQGLSGILHNAAYQNPNLSKPINEAIGHLQSVAVIHGLQGKNLDASIEMRELTHAICKNIQDIWQTEIQYESNEDWVNCHLSKSEAVPIALILNELITNAEKHHSGTEAIVVSIVQIVENEKLREISIDVKNEGNFVVNSNLDQDAEHFGLRLINSLMPKAGAYLYLTSRDNITQATLTLKPPIVKEFNTFLQSRT